MSAEVKIFVNDPELFPSNDKSKSNKLVNVRLLQPRTVQEPTTEELDFLTKEKEQFNTAVSSAGMTFNEITDSWTAPLHDSRVINLLGRNHPLNNPDFMAELQSKDKSKFQEFMEMIGASKSKKEAKKALKKYICSWEGYRKYYYEHAIKLVSDLETKGFLFVGAPGTGKGLFMSAVVYVAYHWEKFAPRDSKGNQALPAKGVIYAAKGDEYFRSFYNPKKDVLLNFCDTRGEGYLWNFLEEMELVTDASAIAESLIPPMEKVDPFWRNAPRDIFEGLVLYCWKNNKKTYADLYAACTAPGLEMQKMLNETEGAEGGRRYLEDPTSKMAQSVLSVLSQEVKCFSLMSRKPSKPFFIEEWIQKGEGFIYLTNPKALRAVLKGFYTLFIDTLARKILTMDSDLDRRVFLFLDEFATLNKCMSILEMLNQGRSKGMSVFIGVQGIPQIDSVYGEFDRQALITGCATKLIFNMGDTSSGKYFEDFFGKKDETASKLTFTSKVDDDSDGTNVSIEEKEKTLLKSGELTNIPERHAFLMMRGYPITLVEFPILVIPYQEDVPSLIIREDLKLPNKYKNVDLCDGKAPEIRVSEYQVEGVPTPANYKPELTESVLSEDEIMDNYIKGSN